MHVSRPVTVCLCESMSLYLLYVSVYMCAYVHLCVSLSFYVSTFHMHSHVKECTHMDTPIHVLTVFAHMLQACPEPYLSIRERVVVGPHLWVHVLQVPLEAATL